MKYKEEGKAFIPQQTVHRKAHCCAVRCGSQSHSPSKVTVCCVETLFKTKCKTELKPNTAILDNTADMTVIINVTPAFSVLKEGGDGLMSSFQNADTWVHTHTHRGRIKKGSSAHKKKLTGR